MKALVVFLAMACARGAARQAGRYRFDGLGGARRLRRDFRTGGDSRLGSLPALFADGARLISMRVTAEGPAALVMSPDDYAKRAGANFEKNGFFESELARRVETFGNIAHVFSTYESRRAPGDKPFARGINSFQLVKDGQAWKVMTILWDAEREGESGSRRST